MKILHFLGIGRLPIRPMVDATGGTERVALEIARIQVRRGHLVTIASLDDEAWQGTRQGVKLARLQPTPTNIISNYRRRFDGLFTETAKVERTR